MLELYILFTYIIGYLMTYDTYKTSGVLQIIDLIMFLLSPISMTNLIIIKTVSHFIDIETVISKR
jgi:hypothetical protein